MGQACFWENGLHLEMQAHRNRNPSFSYTKEKVKGVNLGTNKFLLLLVLLLFGTIKISAQRIKNTKDYVSKTVKQVIDTFKKRTTIFTNCGQENAKADSVNEVRIDTIYLPDSKTLIEKAEPFWSKLKKDAPTDLAKLTIKGILLYFFGLLWKQANLRLRIVRRWRRRRKHKKSFL